MATPMLRVVVSIVEYVRIREWFFVLTTLVVLTELAVGVLYALTARAAMRSQAWPRSALSLVVPFPDVAQDDRRRLMPEGRHLMADGSSGASRNRSSTACRSSMLTSGNVSSTCRSCAGTDPVQARRRRLEPRMMRRRRRRREGRPRRRRQAGTPARRVAVWAPAAAP